MAFLVAQMLQQMQGKFEQMSGAILGRSLSLPFSHIIHLTVFFTFLITVRTAFFIKQLTQWQRESTSLRTR